ncbi:hypothetical protein AB9F29_16800 [Falsihalocynthiibacter sp. S25ZX9]|uniref:hypothetical protein n=1 Tax=Falsihalocynthiibacter sp. S25ZX9 TaxID=3240870 RepID=UPI00350F9608
MDLWNPETFDAALCETLTTHSDLVSDYFAEELHVMNEHLNSDPYESLKSNKYYENYLSLIEHTLTPLLNERRIRVWHYTRLLDDEVAAMQKKLKPSTILGLRQRLDSLVLKGLLTLQESQIVYNESPLHAQESTRSHQVCTIAVPSAPDYSSVVPLLESWGGESAYFWLSDETVLAKLKTIGTPRIVEIETGLGDSSNAFSAAKTAAQAWARTLGVAVDVSVIAVTIKECLGTARVLRVHTADYGVFEGVATTYPSGCGRLLAE